MNIEKEFTTIYNTYAPQVYRLCLGYASGNIDLAKEWQQETFIKVWKHRKTFKGNAAVGTWIYRIAINTCLADLRKIKKKSTVDVTILASDAMEPELRDEEDQIAKMYHCIDQLTENNKALILMELEGMPQATIATTVGIAHGSIRTRLSRIRKALLNCITHEKR